MTDVPAPPAPDPRFELVYAESIRALDHQARAVDELRSRASTLLTAASIAAAFLGARALKPGQPRGPWTAAAIGGFVVVAAAALFVFWPRDGWEFVSSPSAMIATYIYTDEGYDIDDMRWLLADEHDRRYADNELLRSRLTWGIEAACFGLGIEVFAWLVELSRR